MDVNHPCCLPMFLVLPMWNWWSKLLSKEIECCRMLGSIYVKPKITWISVYDKQHEEQQFQVGDWVYLRLTQYRQSSLDVRKNLKLAPYFYEPYKILQKIGQVAYRLELPHGSKIHPTFHVSLLKKQLRIRAAVQATLSPLDVTDNSLLPTPQALLDHQKKNNKQRYWSIGKTWPQLKLLGTTLLTSSSALPPSTLRTRAL